MGSREGLVPGQWDHCEGVGRVLVPGQWDHCEGVGRVLVPGQWDHAKEGGEWGGVEED